MAINASTDADGVTPDAELPMEAGSALEGPPITIDEDVELGQSDLITDSALQVVAGDRFAHLEIAERVAELAAHADLPVNIALFGPWGSGKTSLYNLIERSLEAKKVKSEEFAGIKTIRYDAWKFGGASLKRNFVAQAADDLQVTKDDYRQTLYENVSFIRVPLRAFWVSNWTRTVLTILTVIAVAVAAVLGWSLYDLWFVNIKPSAADPSFWEILWDRSKDGFKLALASVIPLVGGLRLLESARVSVSRDAPSQDEEFERAFHELIKEATAKSWWWKKRNEIANWQIFLDTERKPGMTDEDVVRMHRRKERTRRRIAGPMRWNRVLFFVDELDRCAPDDVLATLVGVKTFLEHPKCVFVVAADRDVLVEALEQPPEESKTTRQVTPLREDAPYYSTAGAFIDKMFQHQIEIPPLRRHALTTFAKKVVEGHTEGIWHDLEQADKLDDVIWALIPLHVQSPRRIKVLLNNFATTARIASARRIEWRSKPIELAKLTVLKTEFPRFAQDLLIEPRLIRHLQNHDAPKNDASETLRRLYRRYTVDAPAQPVAPAAGPSTAAGTETTPANPSTDADREAIPAVPPTDSEDGDNDAAEFTSTGADTKPRRAALARAELTYLRDLNQYLEKAAFAGALGPSRALLYMENVGDREGLSDPGLSDAIDDAPDRSPDSTIEAFNDKPADSVVAIPILAGEVSNQIGPGKRILATVICGLAEGLDAEQLESIAGVAAAAVEPVLTGPLGAGAMIPGGIAIANSPKSRTNPSATIRKFGELVEATDVDSAERLNIEGVTSTLEFLEGTHFKALSAHLAAAFNKGMDGVEPGLTKLSAPVVALFWAEIADPISDEIKSIEQGQVAALAASTTAVVEEPKDNAKIWFISVVHALQERDEPAEHLVIDAFARAITISSAIYAEALEYAESVERTTETDYGTLAALGIQEGPTTDWPTWTRLLGASTLDPIIGSTAIRRVLSEISAVDSTTLATAYDLIKRLHSAPLPEDDLPSIVQLLGSLLTANPWTTSDEQALREFNENVVGLLAQENQDISALYVPVRAADMTAVIQLNTPTLNFTNEVLRCLHTLAADDLPSIVEAADAAFPTYPSNAHGMRLHTHLKTMIPDQSPFPAAALTSLPAGAPRNQIVNDWLLLRPRVEDVVELVNAGITLRVDESLLKYVGGLTNAHRALLWSELRSVGADGKLLEAVAAPGVTVTIARPFFVEATSADHERDRKAAVKTLVTLPLHDEGLIGEASDAIYKLSRTGKSGDVKLAGELAIAARDVKRGHKGKVKRIFDEHRGQFNNKQQIRLTAFNLLSPRRGFTAQVQDYLGGLFR